MLTQRVTMAAAATISLLSACNSTDSITSRGPWDPPHIQRDYPRYSSPWGGWHPGSTEEPSAPLPRPGIYADRALDAHRKVPGIVQVEVDLPSELGLPQHEMALDSVPAAKPAILQSAEPLPLPARHAALPAGANPPGVFSAPSRASSYAGTWRAIGSGKEACTIKLSSVPALDLYKASTSGCGGKLQSINAWSFREGAVILFSRGNVVARLSGEEASLSGSLDGSGEPLRMSR